MIKTKIWRTTFGSFYNFNKKVPANCTVWNICINNEQRTACCGAQPHWSRQICAHHCFAFLILTLSIIILILQIFKLKSPTTGSCLVFVTNQQNFKVWTTMWGIWGETVLMANVVHLWPCVCRMCSGPYKRGLGGQTNNQMWPSSRTRSKSATREKMESKSYNEMMAEATATLADNHTWSNIKPE